MPLPSSTDVEETVENTKEATGDEVESGGITYFVGEDGQYYYQGNEELVAVPTEAGVLDEEPEQLQKEKQQQGSREPNFQTVTLMPSKNCKSEVSYVLVMQEEQQPGVVVKEDKQPHDVYNFVVEEEKAGDNDDQTFKVAESEVKPLRKNCKGNQRANFSCILCSYTSHRRYLLERHMKSHSEDRLHACYICDRSFKTRAALQNHINIHNGVKPNVCGACKAKFTTSGELIRHVRYKHTYEKPHKCMECDYASVEPSKLRRHVRCHSGERPYQCKDCTYASTDSFKLKRHQRTHTGEKPFKCDVCNLCFTQSNSMKTHRLIHNLADKPAFACELCPVKCGRKIDLRIHVQKQHMSDKPIKCKRCGKFFPDRFSCKIHNKIHVGEKCYKCDLCPYASTTARRLKSHMLTHTDEKPFTCNVCNQAFRQKQLLRRHWNLYHNPKNVTKPPMEKTHSCNVCNRTFARKGNLKRHLAIHDPDSVHLERGLKLKLSRQKVKHVEADMLMDLQTEAMDPQVLKIGVSSELNRGEVVTMEDCSDQQFVVLEVMQLEDGTEQQMAVVTPDYYHTLKRSGEKNVVIEIDDTAEDQRPTSVPIDIGN